MAYNKQILTPIKGSGFNKPFAFTKPAAYLLHTVSNIDFDLIKETKLYSRSVYRYLPWYPASKGGGAITLGSRLKTTITFTENFFSSNTDLYKSKAYAYNLNAWLRLAAHEVTHLEHARRFRFLIIYLIVFLYQYVRYGHDRAPLEIEANYGTHSYDAFKYYMRRVEKVDMLETFFDEQLDEESQIQLIDKYWHRFITFEENKGNV